MPTQDLTYIFFLVLVNNNINFVVLIIKHFLSYLKSFHKMMFPFLCRCHWEKENFRHLFEQK